MSLYNLAMAVAAFLIMITMFARLNDLRPDVHKSFIWWVRRLALLQVIAACAMVMAAPVAKNVPHWKELTNLIFTWGAFWVFFTSPNQKPWWDLIFGEHRRSPDRPTGRRARLWDEWRVFVESFRKGGLLDRRTGPKDRRQGEPDRRHEQDAE